jgi:hypothetical protein
MGSEGNRGRTALCGLVEGLLRSDARVPGDIEETVIDKQEQRIARPRVVAVALEEEETQPLFLPVCDKPVHDESEPSPADSAESTLEAWVVPLIAEPEADEAGFITDSLGEADSMDGGLDGSEMVDEEREAPDGPVRRKGRRVSKYVWIALGVVLCLSTFFSLYLLKIL